MLKIYCAKHYNLYISILQKTNVIVSASRQHVYELPEYNVANYNKQIIERMLLVFEEFNGSSSLKTA